MTHRVTSRIEFDILVRALALIHGASETSGFRTKKRNTAVGGADRSRHMDGLARDLVLDEHTPENRAALVLDAGKLGLQALDENDHVHIMAHRSDIPE